MAPTATPNLSTDLDRAAYFAQDPDLIQPLSAAIERSAIDVMAEAGDTPGHALRTNLAIQVLQNPVAAAPQFAWAVSTNPQIAQQWTSEQRSEAIASLQFVVDSVWDAIAGVVAQVPAA